MVYDVHGTPAAADVILRSKADPFDRVVRVRSGADGGFTAELTEGDWCAHAEAGDEVSDSCDVHRDGLKEINQIVRLDLAASATLWGRVVDPAGRPVAGACVLAYASSSRPLSSALTNDTGAYRLQVAAEDWVLLLVRADGYPLLPDSVLTYGCKTVEKTLRLRNATPISGRVVDSAGRAVPAAHVFARVDEYAADRDLYSKEATTDGSGAFVIEGAAWGTWQVRASAPGYVAAEAKFEPWHPGEVELRLCRAGHIEGRVGPIPKAGAENLMWTIALRIELFDVERNRVYVSIGAELGHEGGFAFDSVPPGRYRVIADCLEFAETTSAEFDLHEGDTVRGVTIRLSAGATVRGAIHDERTGDPIPGAEVSMCQDRGESYSGLPCASAEASGQYVLHGLPAGAVDLRFSAPDHADRVLRLDLAAGSEVLQDVLLARGACVRGRIRVDGAPPDGSLGLYLIPGDSSPYRRGKTDADGAYVIRGLGEGDWVIGVSRSAGDAGRQEWSRAFRADGHADVVVEFELSTRPALSGTARVGGDPLSRAHLLFHAGGPEDAVRRVRSDEEGHFQINGLAPGRYVVAIDDDRRSEPDPATGNWPFETDPASLRITVPLGATETRMDLEFPARK